MAMGLPIIGSNFGHISHFIQKDKVGITVDPLNSNAIAEAMKSLMTEPALYETYRENGIRAVDEKYHWRLMEDKLISIYDDLLISREKALKYES